MHQKRRAALPVAVAPRACEPIHERDLAIAEPELRYPHVHVAAQQLVLCPVMSVIYGQLLGRKLHGGDLRVEFGHAGIKP